MSAWRPAGSERARRSRSTDAILSPAKENGIAQRYDNKRAVNQERGGLPSKDHQELRQSEIPSLRKQAQGPPWSYITRSSLRNDQSVLSFCEPRIRRADAALLMLRYIKCAKSVTSHDRVTPTESRGRNQISRRFLEWLLSRYAKSILVRCARAIHDSLLSSVKRWLLLDPRVTHTT